MPSNRRQFLATGAAAMAGSFVNRGRFPRFPGSPIEYSARCVALVERALVIDMLSPITLNFPLMGEMGRQPRTVLRRRFSAVSEQRDQRLPYGGRHRRTGCLPVDLWVHRQLEQPASRNRSVLHPDRLGRRFREN